MAGMHGFIGLILSVVFLGPATPGAPVTVSASEPTPVQQAQDPWPGRPNPPLYRSNPRGYTVGLSVDFGTERFLMAGGAIAMDVATVDTTVVADLRGLEALVRINGTPVPPGLQIEGDPASGQQRVTLALPKGESTAAISTRVTWPAIAFDVAVDEAAFALRCAGSFCPRSSL